MRGDVGLPAAPHSPEAAAAAATLLNAVRDLDHRGGSDVALADVKRELAHSHTEIAHRQKRSHRSWALFGSSSTPNPNVKPFALNRREGAGMNWRNRRIQPTVPIDGSNRPTQPTDAIARHLSPSSAWRLATSTTAIRSAAVPPPLVTRLLHLALGDLIAVCLNGGADGEQLGTNGSAASATCRGRGPGDVGGLAPELTLSPRHGSEVHVGSGDAEWGSPQQHHPEVGGAAACALGWRDV